MTQKCCKSSPPLRGPDLSSAPSSAQVRSGATNGRLGLASILSNASPVPAPAHSAPPADAAAQVTAGTRLTAPTLALVTVPACHPDRAAHRAAVACAQHWGGRIASRYMVHARDQPDITRERLASRLIPRTHVPLARGLTGMNRSLSIAEHTPERSTGSRIIRCDCSILRVSSGLGESRSAPSLLCCRAGPKAR